MARAWQGIVGQLFTADEFALYVAGLTFDRWQPEFIVLHNTQIPNLAQWHDVPAARRIKGLVSWYRDEQKWSAGPHLFVADDGIWVFTPLDTRGVHSPSWNDVAWGVELVGDYDNEEFGDAVKDNALAALTTLHEAMGWTDVHIRLHRDDPKTTHRGCPGRNVRREEIEAKVYDLLNLSK